jgi:hypothetical protein
MAKPKRPSKTRLHDHNYKELAGQLRGKKDSVVTLSWTLYHHDWNPTVDNAALRKLTGLFLCDDCETWQDTESTAEDSCAACGRAASHVYDSFTDDH